jgi:NTP pyrophosphatase (non-canonical NTP hydrolase)
VIDSDDSRQSRLKNSLRKFAEARDWQQFHSPKNLAAALSVEAAELLEHFQWRTEAESKNLEPETHDAVAFEMADVFLYLHLLAEHMDIDLYAVAEQKLLLNEERYPADQVRGRSDKAAHYSGD